MNSQSTMLVAAILLGVVSNLNAQELPALDRIPLSLSAETIKPAHYPVQPDRDLGVSTARLGEGKLYQTELTLVEIPPGGQLPPERHLAEEMIYILAGEGYTSMWTRPGEKPRRYTWSAGDLLSPSLNAWHQHFNSSTAQPVRYVTIITAPLTYNLFQSQEFLSSSDFVFDDRWQQGITRQAEYKRPDDIEMQAGHLLADLPDRKLQSRRKGVLGITIRPEGDMAGNHILELSVREYQDDQSLHTDMSVYPRETVIFVLAGEGSSIMKRSDEPARVVNWEEGDLFIVEANEYFNNGIRIGEVPNPPYPRIMMLKPAGYFIGIGNIVPGSSQYSY